VVGAAIGVGVVLHATRLRLLQLADVDRIGRRGARGDVGDLAFVARRTHRHRVIARGHRTRTQRDAVVAGRLRAVTDGSAAGAAGRGGRAQCGALTATRRAVVADRHTVVAGRGGVRAARRGVAARRRWRTRAVTAGLELATATLVDIVDLLLDAADRLVGRIQLRAIHRVGAGRAQPAGRDVGDLAFVAGAADAHHAGRGTASEHIGRPTDHGAGSRV